MGLKLLRRLRNFFSGKKAEQAADTQTSTSETSRKRRFPEVDVRLMKLRRLDVPAARNNEISPSTSGGGCITSMAERENVPPVMERSSNSLLRQEQKQSDRKRYLKLIENLSSLSTQPPKLQRSTSLKPKQQEPSNNIELERYAQLLNKETPKQLITPLIGASSTKTEALKRRVHKCKFLQNDFEEQFKQKNERLRQETEQKRELAWTEAKKTTKKRRIYEQGLSEHLNNYRLRHKTILMLEKPEFRPFTEDLQKRYNELVQGPDQQVLVSKFNLNLKRCDIRTLMKKKWLNDEVINFYMNLLEDRSQRLAGQLPSVYAMNTFFVQRLLQSGYAGVRRWTRKVDIFSKDIILVPVHVENIHWCMAIIHLKQKSIRYYNSMGKSNQTVLDALEMYLHEESLDKRHLAIDTSNFVIENMSNVPKQNNGSDCGVFTCMYAEYITRDKALNFSQSDMEYFRKKMTLEICDGELWK